MAVEASQLMSVLKLVYSDVLNLSIVNLPFITESEIFPFSFRDIKVTDGLLITSELSFFCSGDYFLKIIVLQNFLICLQHTLFFLSLLVAVYSDSFIIY